MSNEYVFRCKDGNHIGVNNTTGRCPLCGEQVERPSTTGFGYASYLEVKKERCMFDNFKPSDGPLGLVCNCSKCQVR